MQRGKGGFTLIEIVVVLMLVGFLTAIAIPRVSATRQRAYVAAMKSDLRNLAAVQAAHFTSKDVYAASFPISEFHTSDGVTVVIDSASATGWGAHALHTGTAITCTVSSGPSGAGAPACVP